MLNLRGVKPYGVFYRRLKIKNTEDKTGSLLGALQVFRDKYNAVSRPSTHLHLSGVKQVE